MKYLTACFCLILFCVAVSRAQTASPTPTPTVPEPSVRTQIATSESKTMREESADTTRSRYVPKDAPAHIPRFEAPPVIDGQLNDAVWRTAAVFGDFVQIQPGDNISPTHPTEFMMGYDSKTLYLAFRIKQDRNTVRATVARRDNIFNDEYVLLYIDTFNDQRQAYIVAFNPLGVQADGTYTESNGEDYSVDIVMESKGVLTEDGFTIEAAIPFKSLRYEAGKGKQWGLQIFRRVKYANNELDSWMPDKRGVSGSLNKAGHVTGLEGIETTRQLEIIPSFTLNQTSRRTAFTFDNNPAGRYVNDGIKGDFGLTAKFSLSPTTTLDFAYNPDFAQVEADSPISTANLRFPVFFPEKRPFFLERIDIFKTPMNVVNTRAIVDPDIAAKITGRRGKNTFGLMYASDNAPGNLSKDSREGLRICTRDNGLNTDDCPDKRIVDKNADIGVIRLKRDVGRQSNLGFFGTTYNFVDLHNHVGGFDGRIRSGERFTTEFQLVGTNSRRFFYNPELDKNEYRTGNGFGYNLWVERTGRNLYMNYLAFGRSRDYKADVGFTQRTDTNYLGSYIRFETDRDAKKSIIYKRLQNATNISYDWLGRSQYFISDTNGMLALQRQTFIGANLQFGFERVYAHEFRPAVFAGPTMERGAPFKAVQAFIESTPNKQLYLYLFMDYTAGIMEYDFGAGPDFPRASAAYVSYLDQKRQCDADQLPSGFCKTLSEPAQDPGPGNQLTIESTIRYQPTTAFQTQLNYTKRRLVRHDTGLVAFDDNVFSSRSVYQFTRNTFARLRIDYSSLNKRLRPQFVLGWTPNPGTALYIGYNDNVSYNGYNPFTGNYEPGLHGNERTFFIKASYLFRKSF
jgi:hypothetical protein